MVVITFMCLIISFLFVFCNISLKNFHLDVVDNYHSYYKKLLLLLFKNKITRSSITEYLLLKVKIYYTQYFAKNPIGIISL